MGSVRTWVGLATRRVSIAWLTRVGVRLGAGIGLSGNSFSSTVYQSDAENTLLWRLPTRQRPALCRA